MRRRSLQQETPVLDRSVKREGLLASGTREYKGAFVNALEKVGVL